MCAENQVYTEVLAEWAKISDWSVQSNRHRRGLGGRGRTDLRTFHSGRPATHLHPTWDNDWLDLDILASINRIIGTSGKEFVCASDVNFAVVFLLDGESKRDWRQNGGFRS